MLGIDYSFSKPKAEHIKAKGYDFVCRYLSHNPDKNLTKAELDSLRAHGLKIVVVWETTTHRPLAGYEAGKKDAVSARKLLVDLGIEQLHNNPVIYFACDYDFLASQQEAINEYFKGVIEVLGLHRTGVYGGNGVVSRVMEANLAAYGWQTFAWSHGNWYSGAQLRQTENGRPIIDGVECDTNENVKEDFGQFE